MSWKQYSEDKNNDLKLHDEKEYCEWFYSEATFCGCFGDPLNDNYYDIFEQFKFCPFCGKEIKFLSNEEINNMRFASF